VPNVALPQAGGCACGASRYALKRRPLLAYACHCHTCQSRSGAAFSLSLVVRTQDVAMAGAVEERLVLLGERRVHQGFCRVCHIAISGRAAAAPDYSTLLAGTLDDACWVRPIAQTFIESAIPWAIIAGVRSVAWSEFDFVELGREWAASAPDFG
jgi:hypothetical protein